MSRGGKPGGIVLRIVRTKLLRKQSGKCYWCHCVLMSHLERANSDAAPATHPRAATFDHLTPVAEHGRFVRGNIVLACLACNKKRGREYNDLLRRNAAHLLRSPHYAESEHSSE